MKRMLSKMLGICTLSITTAVLVISGVAYFVIQGYDGRDAYAVTVPVSLKYVDKEPAIVDDWSLDSPLFREALKSVLAEYNESYQIRGNELYVSKSLLHDRDTWWNYCLKAQSIVERKAN